MFTIVVAHFATEDDRLTTRRIVSLAAGFAGVIIVIGPDALRDLGVHVAAELASLTAALFYAISGVYGRRFQGEAPAAVSAGLLIMATLWLVPLAALVDRPWTLPVPSAEAILSTMALAVIATAAAYLIYFRVLARAGATNLGLVTFLIPVSAIVLGSAFLGEALEIRHFVGMGGIALGLAAIDGRPQRWLARALKAAKPGASPTK
jgi:drug/metabolite transporter (DMT)-like permease